MHHWLMKSEPDVYSLKDLERDGRTSWTGVRNFRARNFMREMAEGDVALFQHSGPKAAVVGLMKIVSGPSADPEQFDPASEYHDPKSPRADPRWLRVEVAFLRAFPRPAPLAELRTVPALRNMLLFRHSRLSVVPVTSPEFTAIIRLCG